MDQFQEKDHLTKNFRPTNDPPQKITEKSASIFERRPWWYQPQIALLIILVLAIYLSRLTSLPICGEESRWARGAVQMINSGDWVVPRQQGQPYIDRPPLASWAMAAVGFLQLNRIDLLAVRLPSVLAILLTTVMIYAYGRTFLPPLGAFVAGAAFATMGQVLQLGRLGENESVFTFLVSGSLLIWHLGYARRWTMGGTWMVGYALAALGTLQKGPQAPAYFIAASTLYLILRRDWKWLFGWPHLLGILTFTTVFGAWQIPFYLATDWESALGIWTNSAAQRFSLDGLAWHITTYPIETLICMLPWSPLLLGLIRPRVRQSLGKFPEQIFFLLAALAVTYPSVWLASNGKGRYFMPLYPCVSIVIGWITQQCATAKLHSTARQAWNLYVGLTASVIAACGLIFATMNFLAPDTWPEIRQTPGFVLLFTTAALATATVLVKSLTSERPTMIQGAIFCLAAFLGLSYTGTILNVQKARANDMSSVVSQVKQLLPSPKRLISFGPISHRFAYYYGDSIEELPWPIKAGEVPGEITYFCFDRYPSDTAIWRSNGRGIYWEKTPNVLPFTWEEVATVCCDRSGKSEPEYFVIIGRLVRRLPTPYKSLTAVQEVL